MTFEYFCLRLVQVSLHVVWFLLPIIGITIYFAAEDDDATASLGGFIFLISYGLLILGYLNGWNVQ